jgi:hypothetical protein
VYLAIATVIWIGSQNWLALHKHNSFLFELIPMHFLIKTHNTMRNAWMLTNSYWTLQQRSKYPCC